ncbi:phasin family protein [Massilia sp. H6]|uniref:phasin family protein n=1 Tax=Massilia sp. H6 TaxID=2970464 RepID=UPI002168D797|nr:phasin family protein [Massilia sp. H6]UVW28069.1 phasin family protein [Massilia sp. H6]
MTSLAEQFFAAAAGKTAFPMPFAPAPGGQIPAPLRTQVDLLQSFTSQAFDSASRVLALNLATSRASVECATRAAQSLLASRDPRDFLTLGGAAEEQMHSLMSYSRELMRIAGGVQPDAAGLAATAADTAHAASPASDGETELVVVAHSGQEQQQQQQRVAEQPASQSEPVPVAEQTEIVMAAGQGEPQAGVAPHPASAPVPAAEATVQVPKMARPSSSRRRK